MRGRGAVFIAKSHAASCCVTHLAFILSASCPLSRLSSFGPKVCTVFYLLFRGSFWGPFGVQNGSCMVPLESLRSLLSNNIKFAQIGARSEKLWLPEVGVSEQFFCVFPAKIPAKPEMLPANRELHVVAEVALFLKVPNLRINS
jgi:hypothetical protein